MVGIGICICKNVLRKTLPTWAGVQTQQHHRDQRREEDRRAGRGQPGELELGFFGLAQPFPARAFLDADALSIGRYEFIGTTGNGSQFLGGELLELIGALDLMVQRRHLRHVERLHDAEVDRTLLLDQLHPSGNHQ